MAIDKIHPSGHIQSAYIALGTLVGLTLGVLLWVSYVPESGVTTPIVVFVGGLIPLVQIFITKRSRRRGDTK